MRVQARPETALGPSATAPEWSRRTLLQAGACATGALAATVWSPPAAAQPAAKAADWPAQKPAGWDALVEAANREGALVIYGPPTEQVYAALVTRFQRLYPGIKVELTVLGREMTARIMAERSAGRFIPDLYIYGSTSALIAFKPIGGLTPIEPLIVLPEALDPAAWAQKQLWWTDAAAPYTTLMYQGVMLPPVYVNTKLIDPKQFTSYWDLADPKWKGKVCSTDIRTPGPGGVPSAFIYKHPQLGRPWFEKFFGTLDVRLSRDQRQLVDWLVQGQYPMAGFLATEDAQAAMDLGLPIAPVRLEQFKEGGAIGAGFGALDVMNPMPHPNAAKLYVNWLLSRAGQAAWQEETRYPSLRDDIPTDGLLEFHRRQPGFNYVNGSSEEYGRLIGSVLGPTITDVLKQAGRP